MSFRPAETRRSVGETSAGELPFHGKLFVWAIIVCGLLAVAQSVYQQYSASVGTEWLLLAGLTLFSGSFSVKVPSVPATISVSETFVFTIVLLFGTGPATLTVALDGLILSLWRRKRKASRVLFNSSEPALSIWLSSQLFYWAAGIRPIAQEPVGIGPLILPLVLLTATYFLLNSCLTAVVVALQTRTPILLLWRRHFLWMGLNYFGGASVAALLVHNNHNVDFAVLSVIIPLLVISYLTFKTSMGRVDDANRHLNDSNKLYLSTIEALAMAIDAKDQVTHGHIRRVQAYAVGLAQAVGLSDAQQLRAVEAAALLHDMGKLAVPEYILNKPGKLTPAEFDKMKLHASVGADILSSIEFPYPVVPIVRHHHESWNGTGYPDGIKGTDIPIGARILSVVDCFDALTSDRPYRPRLSNEEAVKILLERRGTMYDPLVVDTFLRVYDTLPPPELSIDLHTHALTAITESLSLPAVVTDPKPDKSLHHRAPDVEGVTSLLDLARSLIGQVGLRDASDTIATHIRRFCPFDLAVLYVFDSAADELVAQYTMGDGADIVKGLRIGRGHKLSGWVAANRLTVTNSDPALDFGDLLNSSGSQLKSSLVCPLFVENQLVGVWSLYSFGKESFSEAHRRDVEVIAAHIGETVRQAVDFERMREAVLTDPVTGLPNGEQLRRFAGPSINAAAQTGFHLSILLIDVVEMTRLNKDVGRSYGNDIVVALGLILRRVVRGNDILFRHEVDGFVVMLPNTDSVTSATIAQRISRIVAEELPRKSDDGHVSVTVGAASTDVDSVASLAELILAARRRASIFPVSTSLPVLESPGIH